MYVEWYGDKMQERKIPLKNYFILLAISLGTIFLIFYLASWFNTSKEYYKNNSILSEFLPELKSEELSSYLIDNPEIVIYYASAKDENIKDFEKDFKKLIENYEIKDDLVYIDASKEENVNFVSFLNQFSDKKRDIIAIPNLIYFKEGKVSKILYSDQIKINKRDVRNFLIKSGVITND